MSISYSPRDTAPREIRSFANKALAGKGEIDKFRSAPYRWSAQARASKGGFKNHLEKNSQRWIKLFSVAAGQSRSYLEGMFRPFYLGRKCTVQEPRTIACTRGEWPAINRAADGRERRDKGRWDIIQFYEPPLRLRYLYKSAVETRRIANWIHRSIYYRRPRCCTYVLPRLSPFCPPPAPISLLAHIETIVLFLRVFCSPLRQVRDGLTRNYLLSKFLREKLLLCAAAV